MRLRVMIMILTDVPGALRIKHPECLPDLVLRILLPHLPEHEHTELLPLHRLAPVNIYLMSELDEFQI